MDYCKTGRRNHKKLSTLLLLVAVFFGASGCGGRYDSSVTGKVTFDGKPLTRGSVTFTNVTSRLLSYSQIDSSGRYTIRIGREEGLPPGEYQVTVEADEPSGVKISESDGPPPMGKPITPAWYRSAETSGLKFTVTPGSNKIDLVLTSTPPANWKPKKRRR